MTTKRSRHETMGAVVVRAHGDAATLRVEEVPAPRAGPGQVSVDVKACGLNHLDVWVRRGVPGHVFPLPLIPGSDVAGVVSEVGPGVVHLREGDRVVVAPGISCGQCPACASGRDPLCRSYGLLGETRDGGCAQRLVVPARSAIALSDRLDFVAAACLPVVFLTAWHMLVDRAQLRPGETVLVHAGGSGVGSAAIQIARLWQARVLTTVGSPDKVERARALGASEVILYRETDFASEVRALTGKTGADVIVDHVGRDTFAGNMRCLAKGGRMVTCGTTSGPEVALDLRPLFFKGQSILGSTMGSTGELIEVLRLAAQGLLRPVLDRTLPLAQIGQAHRSLEERKGFGKIVMEP